MTKSSATVDGIMVLWDGIRDHKKRNEVFFMTSRYVRDFLKQHRLRSYELASEAGVSEYTLCRWLRANELPTAQAERIERAMKSLIKKISEARNEQM